MTKVQDLIDDLGYTWSQCEADQFSYYMKTKDIDSAQTMLKKEGYNDEEIKSVIDYLVQKINGKKFLVECKNYDLLEIEDKVLISYGGHIFQTRIVVQMINNLSKKCFFNHSENMMGDYYVPVENAVQIWEIKNE